MKDHHHAETARPAPQAPLDRVHVRGRLLAAFAFALLVVWLESWPALGAAATVAVLLAALGGMPWHQLRHRLLAANFLAAGLTALMPLSWTISGGWTWNPGRVDEALRIGLRLNAIVPAVSLLAGTVPPVRLARALSGFGLPGKLIEILYFMVRYGAEFRREGKRLHDAMRLRAFRPRPTPHGFRTLGYLAGLMIVRAIDRSERVRQAMKCRGFAGRFHLLAPEPLGWPDLLLAFGTVGCAMGLIAIERML